MASKNSIKCRRCDRRYSRLRHKCPYCGAKKKGNSKRAIYDTTPKWQLVVSVVILIAVAAIVAVLIIMSVSGNSKNKDNTPADNGQSVNDTDLNTGDDGVSNITGDGTGDNSTGNNTDDVKVNSISLDHTDITLTETGEQVTITATVVPANAGSDIEWVSTDETVCMVSSAGVVTAVGKGDATVYAQADGVKSPECIIRVTGNGGNAELSHTDVTIDSSISETFILSVSGNSGTPYYSVGNSAVATVSEEGRVTAVSPGNTTVTVTVDGQTLECIVRVN